MKASGTAIQRLGMTARLTGSLIWSKTLEGGWCFWSSCCPGSVEGLLGDMFAAAAEIKINQGLIDQWSTTIANLRFETWGHLTTPLTLTWMPPYQQAGKQLWTHLAWQMVRWRIERRIICEIWGKTTHTCCITTLPLTCCEIKNQTRRDMRNHPWPASGT